MTKDRTKYSKIYKQLGENIRKYRKKRKISQEELAFRISSARNYIGCIERAEKAPSLATVFDIFSSFCSIYKLLKSPYCLIILL